MKIKQVCELTGLTERTVRYYVEQRLISPKTEYINDREYRDYSRQDVKELKAISNLRKLNFSIEEIKTMIGEPIKIAEIVEDYKVRLSKDLEDKQQINNIINKIDQTKIYSIFDLVSNFETISKSLPLPKSDAEPNFKKFETISDEEKQMEYKMFLQRQKRTVDTGRTIVFSISAINIILSIISFFVSFNVLALILNIVLCVVLFMGVSWVRYYYAVCAAFGIFAYTYLLYLICSNAANANALMIAFIIFNLIFSVFSAVTLFKSKAVSEFLYEQRSA